LRSSEAFLSENFVQASIFLSENFVQASTSISLEDVFKAACAFSKENKQKQ